MTRPTTPKLANGIARSPTESRYPHLWNGLKGLWVPSIGVQGMHLVDFSGNGNTGTLTNMSASDWKSDGLNYDDTDNHVACGNDVNVGLLTAVAVAFMPSTADGFNNSFGGKYNNNAVNDRTFHFGPFGGSDSDFRYVLSTDGSNFFSYHDSSTQVNDGSWHVWVVTWDGTTGQAYRDGEELSLSVAAQSGTPSGELHTSTQEFRIGAIADSSSGSNYYDGLIDTYAVYNRVLSEQEILELYTGRHPLERRPLRVFAFVQPDSGPTKPIIAALPDAPQRGESFDTFKSKAKAHLAALDTWTSEVNSTGSYIYTKATTIEIDTSGIESDSDAATSAANFEGDWSDLTGSLSVPAAVRHNNLYWMLLSDIADVTASEPGVSSDWGVLLNNLFDDVTDFTVTYDASDRVDTITETLKFGTRIIEYAYNSDNTVNTATITLEGRQRVETFSYTSGEVTGMSSTESDAP